MYMVLHIKSFLNFFAPNVFPVAAFTRGGLQSLWSLMYLQREKRARSAARRRSRREEGGDRLTFCCAFAS